MTTTQPPRGRISYEFINIEWAKLLRVGCMVEINQHRTPDHRQLGCNAKVKAIVQVRSGITGIFLGRSISESSLLHGERFHPPAMRGQIKGDPDSLVELCGPKNTCHQRMGIEGDIDFRAAHRFQTINREVHAP